eukprot:gb/GECG01008803.1/.p1 GENE.gb/GECG01008803.1/~~gb/GECG01008803.1/.p1  ORF type:complete len:103 (+),score=15.42 gb/GECG01008803.1/:1-309(+)
MLRSLFHPFNSSKLKAALQMAKHRIRLVKNKRTEEIRRERQSVAEALLEGKVERAKVRAESVVRKQEEQIAYEAVEDICDTVAQRLVSDKQLVRLPLPLNGR